VVVDKLMLRTPPPQQQQVAVKSRKPWCPHYAAAGYSQSFRW